MTIDEGYIKYDSHWTPGPATHVMVARELDRLYRLAGLREAVLAVLAGHDERLISFGTTLEQAANRILRISRALL